MEIISLVSGFVSIVLGAYAIWFAWKESRQSSENYNKTKELLATIEAKSELIDRSVQLQQTQLLAIINKALDKLGQPPIDMRPISLEEIDALVNEKIIAVEVPNHAGGETVIIDKAKNISSALKKELSNI